ncbi:MAG: hypothetical protein AAF078_02925 [Planctomycetota bacterium]
MRGATFGLTRRVTAVAALLLVGGSASGAAINELFVDGGATGGAVELSLTSPGDAQAASGGVTLIAATVEGPLRGRVLGSWYVPGSAEQFVLLHETELTGLAGFRAPVTTATASVMVPAWDRVALGVFAGDARWVVSSPGASLDSPGTQALLGTQGLLTGITVTPTGVAGWMPDAAAIGRMGGDAGDWAAAVVSGDGVYRPQPGGEWIGGAVGPEGDVAGPGYAFTPSPGRANAVGEVAVLPEPVGVSAAAVAWLASLAWGGRSRR